MNHADFFMATNTPDGFYSLFKELYDPYSDWKMYIIKGGPGTGKSTIIKAVAAQAELKGLFTEIIHCSSDPQSLDAVIIPEIKVAVADGTSPHIINPVFPGVCEHTVDLSCCWNSDLLKNDSSKIKMFYMTNSAAHKKCVKYLKAASLLNKEIRIYIDNIINYDKIERFALRFSDIHLNKNNESFHVKNRILNTITPEGIKLFTDTIDYYCDEVIIIKDSYYISDILLTSIYKNAANKKINTVICRNPMNPENKISHLIFPDLRLGIFTSDYYLNIKGNKTVSTTRFLNKDELNKIRNIILFLKKAENELITEAIESLKTAKSAHDILENYYINAMNFEKVNIMKNNLLNDIFN